MYNIVNIIFSVYVCLKESIFVLVYICKKNRSMTKKLSVGAGVVSDAPLIIS